MTSAVAGLQAHQQAMDVIANNIANVNTVGFKSSQVAFEDTFYQTIQSPTSPNAAGQGGGSNGMQIGYGSTVGSIDTSFMQGAFGSTGDPMDLYINGDGFFRVQDAEGNIYYTRMGNFDFDTNGYLVDSKGNYVTGFKEGDVEAAAQWEKDLEDYSQAQMDYENYLENAADYESDHDAWQAAHDEWTALNDQYQIDYGNWQTAHETWTAGNEAYQQYLADMEQWQIEYEAWDMTDGVLDGADSTGTAGPAPTEPTAVADPGPEPAEPVGPGPEPIEPSEPVPVDEPVEPEYQFDAEGNPISAPLPGERKYDPTTGEYDKDGSQIPPVTEDDLAPIQVDDFTKYTDVTIGTDGQITALDSTTNEVIAIGQIALADIPNPGGMMAQGGGYYTLSGNSGEPVYGAPTGSTTGELISGGLEMSNVDLSKEFTDMITIQRGFQACARIITTSDEMLQEIINLKR